MQLVLIETEMADFAIIGYVVIDMILGTQGERVQLGGFLRMVPYLRKNLGNR